MSITRGGITRGGITSGGILRSQQGQPYAFNFDDVTGLDRVSGNYIDDGVFTNLAANFPALYKTLNGEVVSGVKQI